MISTINTLGILAIVAINVMSLGGFTSEKIVTPEPVQYDESKVIAPKPCIQGFVVDNEKNCRDIENLSAIDPARELEI